MTKVKGIIFTIVNRAVLYSFQTEKMLLSYFHIGYHCLGIQHYKYSCKNQYYFHTQHSGDNRFLQDTHQFLQRECENKKGGSILLVIKKIKNNLPLVFKGINITYILEACQWQLFPLPLKLRPIQSCLTFSIQIWLSYKSQRI